MNTYQCKNDIITKEERKKLLSESMNFKLWSDRVSTYKPVEADTGIIVMKSKEGDTYKATKDYEKFMIKSPLEGLFTKLVNKTNPKLKFFIAAYVKFADNNGVVTHKDTDTIVGRRSCVNWALSPLKQFPPIRFYNEDKTFNEDVYYKEKPLIVNTGNYHSVNNTSGQPRYSFQICFYDPIETLVKLDQKGELFI